MGGGVQNLHPERPEASTYPDDADEAARRPVGLPSTGLLRTWMATPGNRATAGFREIRPAKLGEIRQRSPVL